MKPGIENSSKAKKLDWGNIAFLTLSPPLALAGTIAYSVTHAIHPLEIALFFIFYFLTGISITGGYHRFYAHKSYSAHPLLQMLYLLFGAAALQNSVLRWARDHRLHHQEVDTDEDPYNILRGAFYAHMGWIFFKAPEDRNFKVVPDLLKNKLVLWQDRHYLPIAILVSFGLPTLIGWSIGRPLGGFLWGGLLRVVLVHHMTFCINSLAHMVGTQPYSLNNTARDSSWLAFITYGEGYHNFHHRFAADYRNGYRWYQWDPTKWWIRAMAGLGLAKRLVRFRDELILRARIETDWQRAHKRIANAPQGLSARLALRLASARQQLELAAAQWESAKLRYRTLKKSMFMGSGVARKQWKIQLRQHSFALATAQARWGLLITALSRLPQYSDTI
jgi:stearoyl-CoA desaturase (delta-9 desaturase)